MDNPQPVLSPEPPAAPTRPARGYPAAIFVGSNGLRAGWRFLLFNLLWFLFVGVFGAVIRAIVHPPRNRPAVLAPLTDITQELVFLLSMTIALLIMFKIEHRPFQFEWLPSRGLFGRNFWVGAIWGVCSLLVLLLMMRGLNDFYFGPLALRGWVIAKFALLWAIGFTLVGLFEESFWRGYPQRVLSSGIGFWPAAVITSVWFGLSHSGNPGEAPLGLASVVAVGLVLSFTLWRTGNLWFAVGLHFGWDYAETFIFGVPDSGLTATGHLLTPKFQGSHWITGGTVGPEGSVLVFVVYGLLALAFHFAYPKRQLVLDFAPPKPASTPEPTEGAVL